MKLKKKEHSDLRKILQEDAKIKSDYSTNQYVKNFLEKQLHY